MSFAHEPTNCPGVSERSKNNNIYNTKLNPNKSPDYDPITGKILKKAIVYITTPFNGIIRTSHIPSEWKVAQVIMIPKSGSYILPTDKFIANCVKTIWETTTGTVKNFSKRG